MKTSIEHIIDYEEKDDKRIEFVFYCNVRNPKEADYAVNTIRACTGKGGGRCFNDYYEAAKYYDALVKNI